MGAARFTLLTPRGAAVIAVVAVTGAGREAVAARWLRTAAGRVPGLDELAVPRLCALVAGGRTIDDVLAVDRPRLATLELHLHGSEAVLAAFERDIARLEAPDPDAAEGLLQHALDPAQIALALEQRVAPLRILLARLAELPPDQRGAAARAAVERSRVALAQVEPARLVICGAQNAGKSTLMNRLLWRSRVLTGAEPGLTRDPVAETVVLGGYPYVLVDTAGHGPVRDDLDRSAQQRAAEARRGAFRLLVVDGALGPSARDRELADAGTVWIRNKSDLAQAPWPGELGPVLAASCLDPQRALALRAEIGAMLRALRRLPAAGPVGGPAALSRAELLSLVSFVPDEPHG